MSDHMWALRIAMWLGMLGVGVFPSLATWADPLHPTSAAGWHVVQGPDVGTYGTLSGIASVTPKDVWAVGTSRNGALTEHWNRHGWRVVPAYNPVPSQPGEGTQFIGVGASPHGDVWVVGNWATFCAMHPLIEHWMGQRWVASAPEVPPSSDGELYAVSVLSRDDAWAVGGYSHRSTCGPSPPPHATQPHSHPLVERWDGTHWRIVHVPSGSGVDTSLTALSVVSSNDIWAAGNVTWDTSNRPLVEHFDGHTWHEVPMPDQGIKHRTLNQVQAINAHDVWVTGEYWAATMGPHNLWVMTLVEHWNGSRWSISPSANSPCHQSWFGSMSVLGSHDGWAVGGGNYCTGSRQKGLIERWDGTRWRVFEVSGRGASLSGLVFPRTGGGWAVGAWTPTGGNTLPLIEQYVAGR